MKIPPKHWHELKMYQTECSEDRINVISISELSVILSYKKTQVPKLTVQSRCGNTAKIAAEYKQ